MKASYRRMLVGGFVVALLVVGGAVLNGADAATVGFLFVTWIYVDLTGTIAESAISASRAANNSVKIAWKELEARELQDIAAELPTVFHQWVRTVVNMHPQPDGNVYRSLQEQEGHHRVRLMALRHRLPVDDDYIATEIDRAIVGYTEWVQELEANAPPAANEVHLDDRLRMAFTAATIFVTANLPARVREHLDEAGREIKDRMNSSTETDGTD